ncbi:hypothetical protein [Bradyrhizobium sp.]|nr:hypothetical protein [Bradyrhizobium sp.]MBV8916596.1 hypothetical protein [Bradyrhizobium sp.]MBV9979420.1 hypothetical protein [Bradyrhizobium sp.]
MLLQHARFHRFGPGLPMTRDRQLRRGGLICKYVAGLKSPLAVLRPGPDV